MIFKIRLHRPGSGCSNRRSCWKPLQATQWQSMVGASPDPWKRFAQELWIHLATASVSRYIPRTSSLTAQTGPGFWAHIRRWRPWRPDGSESFDGSSRNTSDVLLVPEAKHTNPPTPAPTYTISLTGNSNSYHLQFTPTWAWSTSPVSPSRELFTRRESSRAITSALHKQPAWSAAKPEDKRGRRHGEIVTMEQAHRPVLDAFLRGTIVVQVGTHSEVGESRSINHTVTFGTEPPIRGQSPRNVTVSSDGRRPAVLRLQKTLGSSQLNAAGSPNQTTFSGDLHSSRNFQLHFAPFMISQDGRRACSLKVFIGLLILYVFGSTPGIARPDADLSGHIQAPHT